MRELDGRSSVRPTCRFDLSRPHRLEAHRKPLTGLLPFRVGRYSVDKEQRGPRGPSTILYRAPRPRVFGHGDSAGDRRRPVGPSDGHVARPCPGRDPRTPLVIPGRRRSRGFAPLSKQKRLPPLGLGHPSGARERAGFTLTVTILATTYPHLCSTRACLGATPRFPRLPPGTPFGRVITDRASTRR